MAYWFTGFFAKPLIERPAVLPITAAWRDIIAPFAGVGVRLSALADDEPGPDEARRLLREVGLSEAADWVFLNYVTWAGRIDGVYGLGSFSGSAFGPVSESDGDQAHLAYLALMSKFGMSSAEALDFPPFARGFWGE